MRTRAMTLTAKIKALRIRAGLTMAEAAKRGGWRQPSSYQRYENPEVFRRHYLPLDIAQKLVKAFAGLGSPQITAPEVLALSQLPSAASQRLVNSSRVIEVIAVVEAGVWREAFELPPEDRKYFPMPSLPGYEGVAVFGLEVRGQSMNKVYPEGSIAFFVRPEDLEPHEGHVVVALARRGDLYETTLKELRREKGGRVALWPLSTDARHQKPIYPDEAGAESVEIIGVAIGKFELLTPPSRART